MSGGSMNYLYRRILWEADFEDTTELRKEFRMHLVVVAAALKAIEWVDSGDMSPGDEDEAIAVVLGSTSRGQKMRDAGYTRRPTLREMIEDEQPEQDLLEALKDAADAIEHWGSYVDNYFKIKHDLQGDIDRARDAIAKAEGKPINYFRVQEIAINRGLDYNKFAAAMRDYLGLE